MVWIPGKCSNCGWEVEIWVSQGRDREELMWNAAYDCHACGATIEFDERGTLPI